MRRGSIALKVAAAALTLATIHPMPASAATTFKIENKGDHTIEAIYVTNAGTRTWGQDLLESDTLDPGYFETIRAYSCAVDIRIVYDNKQVDDERKWDACDYNYVSNY